MARDSVVPSGPLWITGDHPEYDARRATFNGTIDRRPVEIHVCQDLADVVAAVRRARRMQLPVSIRGGGHSVAGHCVGEGALAIDLSGMRRIEVDPEACTAAAGGGATWLDYDRATQDFGLASTGGTFTDTGIGGLTLGGGIGFLMGTQGLTVDTLIGVQLVTADGDVVHASTDENADLFWALRGAGANFGVVTRFEYAVRPVPELYGGMITYPMSSAADVLGACRDLIEGAPDELNLQFVAGGRAGDSVVLVCFQGSAAEGERLVRPLRAAAPIVNDEIRSLTYAEMQATNGLVPFGLRHYWKGQFMAAFPDEVVAFSAEHLERRPATGLSTILIEFINGAPLRVPVDAMAFNQRGARVNASALAIWLSPDADREHIAWARAYTAGVSPKGGGAEYVNYMAETVHQDRLRAAYGAVKFERLRELKRRFDPDNIFRFNQNITPAA